MNTPTIADGIEARGAGHGGPGCAFADGIEARGAGHGGPGCAFADGIEARGAGHGGPGCALSRQPTITARALERSFQTGAIETPVLRGVSLDIFPGELTLIMGPSGSGKSTLLAVLSGLLKPNHGEVRVLDNDLTALDDDALDRFRLENCGFIFQGFNLFSALTALEQVLLVLQYAGVTGAAAQARAEQALAEVDLTPRATLRPLELSGGEKQRVAIARSLVKNPPLLFADEPTSALDSHNGERVIALLHHAARTRNATIVIVTHDPRLLKHADRVLYLEDGVITRDECATSRSPGASS